MRCQADNLGGNLRAQAQAIKVAINHRGPQIANMWAQPGAPKTPLELAVEALAGDYYCRCTEASA